MLTPVLKWIFVNKRLEFTEKLWGLLLLLDIELVPKTITTFSINLLAIVCTSKFQFSKMNIQQQ